jgi:arsenite methyltransferase
MTTDVWGEWILRSRDGGAAGSRKRLFDRLTPVRDAILAGADLSGGETVLDVGCGDGFISFAALEAVGAAGHVIFLDISDRVLDSCRAEAGLRNELERSSFVRASADDLSGVEDQCVDAITTRSVLIYLRDKSLAFAEFRRALRPGGRISLWEPINSHGEPEPAHHLLGFDLSDVAPLGERVKAAFTRHQPPESDPMLDFDERDLLSWAEQAGFTDLSLRLEIEDAAPEPAVDWEAFLDSSPNPLALTWRQAIAEALTPAEAPMFLLAFREIAEAGKGRYRRAGAHLVGRRA